MPRFKVHLVTTVEVSASCDIELEAETKEEAEDKAVTTYEAMEKDYEKAYQAYRREGGEYPSAPYYWSADDDDVYNAVNSEEIEVGRIEEIEA